MAIDITKLKVGDKVHYQPGHYPRNEWENGIIKEIPPFATDKTAQTGYNCVRVVYNCNNEWHRYEDFTSALTRAEDLNLGWRE